MLQQWMITVGILVSYLTAIYKSMPDSAATLDWRLILGLGAVPALIGFVLRTRMPESPRWLIRQGRYEDARLSLAKLGVDVTTEQIERAGSEITAGEDRRGPSPVALLDPGRAPGAHCRVPVLHIPANHRHQCAALLWAEAARPTVPER